MSSIHRKRRTIYIGEKAYDSLTEAAAVLGVPKSSLHKRLRYGGECVIGGIRVADTPPTRVFIESAITRGHGSL